MVEEKNTTDHVWVIPRSKIKEMKARTDLPPLEIPAFLREAEKKTNSDKPEKEKIL